ncbi:hypothetical protein [Nitrospirillum iridis]|uniref:Uncharacterized protein n=1 Tax=Nitrospirillum iridis TaxID=765888 RepID=A0A7X0AU58_9PROT|nr:hypothetical protein [Nitrospirillum iridis]MBB6250098.1 hypothetical protein [Nitrospirillum iridis]
MTRPAILPPALLYAVAYLLASGWDLWTTMLALRAGAGVHEGNVFTLADVGYSLGRAGAITLMGGLAQLALFVFGVRNVTRIAPLWLDRPLASFRRPYLNPWSRRHIDRSPLHALSYALAFISLRLLAAGNNWILAEGGTGPLGLLVTWATRLTTPLIGFALSMGGLYLLLALALSPLAAGLARWLMNDPALPSVPLPRARNAG